MSNGCCGTIKKEFVDREYQLGRDRRFGLIELYVSSCVLRRLEPALWTKPRWRFVTTCWPAGIFSATAERRIATNLAALWDNDDGLATATADAALGPKPH